MAMKATIRDLRVHTRELIAATDRGEEVIITYRGRARARLVPLADERQPAGRNPAFGLWQDRSGTVDEHVDALREGRSFG